MANGPPMLTPRVEPSGAAFATVSVPRLPLAPGLFSTTNELAGYLCCRPSATRRATMSGVDPGPKGTTIRTVLVGQLCAGSGVAAPNSSRSAPMRGAIAVIQENVLRGDSLHWWPLSSTAAAIRRECSMGLGILILGLLVLLGGHVFVSLRHARAAVVERLGLPVYRGGFALVSLVGLALIIWGYGLYRAHEWIQVWSPPGYMRHITI